MNTVINEISKCFARHDILQDEQVFFAISRLAGEYLETPDGFSNSEFDNALLQFDRAWQHHQLDGISKEQVYLYGAVWGSLRLLDAMKKQKEESNTCGQLAEKYKNDNDYLELLSALGKTPGTSFSTLSKEYGDKVETVIQDGLVSVQEFSDSCCFLKTRGEHVLEILEIMEDKL